MSDLNTIKVETKPKPNVQVNMDIIAKWKKVPRNQYIMRWKALRNMKKLLEFDFDRFLNEVNGNEELINILLNTHNISGDLIYDDKTNQMKYDVESTPLWERMQFESLDTLNGWKTEYENWLTEKSN